MTSLLWLRDDLRRTDHRALQRAAQAGPVLVVIVLDPRYWTGKDEGGRGALPRAWRAATVLACLDSFEDRVALLSGEPEQVLPAVATAVQASQVVVTGATTGPGRQRDDRVSERLAQQGVDWVVADWPLAVAPGTIRSQAGGAFKVFGPWYRHWQTVPRRAPIATNPEWLDHRVEAGPARQLLRAALTVPGLPALPEAGEQAAQRRWQKVLDQVVGDYHLRRDLPAVPGTSRLSADLRVGALHPRSLLADLDQVAATEPGESSGVAEFIRQLAWRDFYADVLWDRPDSAWADYRPGLEQVVDEPDEQLLERWRRGQTGYPIVDAGMRQLLATGWMHNRVRMIVASFLVKDLHQPWQAGARHFLDYLLDGDLASNSHGWQWVAGTGTDPSPYVRIFNPTSQGERFDPDGDYVRRWVPELAAIEGKAVHRPWKVGPVDYPAPMVDHDQERLTSLERYRQAKVAQL